MAFSLVQNNPGYDWRKRAKRGGWLVQPWSGSEPFGAGSDWFGNIAPEALPNVSIHGDLAQRIPGYDPSDVNEATGLSPAQKESALYKQFKRGRSIESGQLDKWGKLPASATMMPKSSTFGKSGGKWKKIIEQLGKMTGPEPDWSLSAKKMGVPSPWSPTNVAWSAVGRPDNKFGVGRTMLDFKKKKGPY